MGWLGWTEDAAQSADVNAIQQAMRGRVAMLRAIFGGDDAGSGKSPPETTVSGRPLTPELFDAIF